MYDKSGLFMEKNRVKRVMYDTKIVFKSVTKMHQKGAKKGHV